MKRRNLEIEPYRIMKEIKETVSSTAVAMTVAESMSELEAEILKQALKRIALLTQRLTIEEMVELCNQHIASALAAGMETGSIELVRNAAIRKLEWR